MRFASIKFCIILIALASCSLRKEKAITSNPLEESFQNSKKAINEFLHDWSAHSDSLSTTNQSLLEKEFRLIHQVIFNPFDYRQFGWKDWDWTRFSMSKYVVVQTEMPFHKVETIDTLNQDINFLDTLKSFYSNTKFKDVQTLYLTPKYEAIFKNFFGYRGFNETEIERSVFHEKKKFFNNYIVLSHGYDYHVILTQPLITGIQISNDFLTATVDFELQETGLRSFLKKKNSKWTITKTKTIWIE